MNDSDSIEDLAFKWVKSNRSKIIRKFCISSVYPSYDKPTLLFMAGAPGAGKTEYSISQRVFLLMLF